MIVESCAVGASLRGCSARACCPPQVTEAAAEAFRSGWRFVFTFAPCRQFPERSRVAF